MGRLITRREWTAINTKSKRRNFLHRLRQQGHSDLADEIEQCGQPIDNDRIYYPARHRCGSVYCVKCHAEYVDKQTAAVRALFNRYGTEAEQRENIVHLTIDFDAFRLFTRKGQLLVPKAPPAETEFPTEYALSSLKDARHALKHKLRHKFPGIGYVGAFEWELFRDETLNWRKEGVEAVMSLLGADEIRDPRLSEAQANIVLFHAHIVVDLNGTPKEEFRTWMRDEFTKRCGLPSRRTPFMSNLCSETAVSKTASMASPVIP